VGSVPPAAPPRRHAVLHGLRVAAVEPLTEDSVTITFEIPDGLRDVYDFVQGQHVSVRCRVAGDELRRNYSICTAAGSGVLRIAVKRLEGRKKPYDVLLIDIHLDEHHTGFDLFEQLRLEGHGRERRVVFTTGDSMSAKTRDALRISERPVLRKPFNLEDLREMLDRVAGP